MLQSLFQPILLERLKKSYENLIEKAALSSFKLHLNENKLLPAYHSAYREDSRTEMALVKVQNDLLLVMDNQKVSFFVALDLSAAFDTVDHNILKKILERRFGVTGLAHRLFCSYLESRSQRVKIENFFSDFLQLNYGVPQGSCACPVLYSIYASTQSDNSAVTHCLLISPTAHVFSPYFSLHQFSYFSSTFPYIRINSPAQNSTKTL